MTDESTTLTSEETVALGRLQKRLAQDAEQVEQALRMVERLADSGLLAGVNAVLGDFDESFNALTRPDLMTMVTNLMMVLGMLSQLPYESTFRLAMDAPEALNEAYPRFRARTQPMSLREALRVVRSPDVAAAMEVLVTVLRSQRRP
jgi:uncharacterized protein YjgD (DUF1641 family)